MTILSFGVISSRFGEIYAVLSAVLTIASKIKMLQNVNLTGGDVLSVLETRELAKPNGVADLRSRIMEERGLLTVLIRTGSKLPYYQF